MKKIKLKDVIYLIIILLLVAAVVTLGVFLAKGKKKVDLSEYYDKKCAAFVLENSNYSQGQIVFIGDSITDGYHLSDFYADLPLATYNRGIGGDKSDGVRKRLKISLYDIAPTKIVLLIGINDINGGVTNEEIMTNYEAILQGIKMHLPEAEVTCISVLPMNDRVSEWDIDVPKSTAQVKALNARIQPLAESMGYRYVDLFSLLADENDRLPDAYTTDGLHLSDAAYAVWTSVVKPYLQ